MALLKEYIYYMTAGEFQLECVENHSIQREDRLQ